MAFCEECDVHLCMKVILSHCYMFIEVDINSVFCVCRMFY